MATTLNQWLVVCVIFSTCINYYGGSNGAKMLPTQDRVNEWSDRIDQQLDYLLSTLSVYYSVAKEYQNQYPISQGSDLDVGVSFEEVKTKELVHTMADELSQMLQRKMTALQNSVDKAEKAAAEHKWDGSLTKKDVNYDNAKKMMDVELHYNDRFDQKVNFDFSSVHIPVEIYDGDLEILNGLNWTSKLDRVFEENYKKDPEILWQYFGSQAGFMRTYPASAWETRGPVDLYDVRRQSWYTQGSSSPKDMMILIDTSGSTHGQALQLMKVAVKSILDTLGENDFVNIAKFSSDAKFVSPCFNHTPFVQANYRNKQRLSNDVNLLDANGMANFKAGLTFAFEQFARFERNESDPADDNRQFGASCNKVIMMLTDGGTDNAEEVFKEFNWPNKTVRVFTYAVGPTANPTNAIRWMACANRGYFSQIPAMGAIRTRVQEYVGVLARPLAIQHIEHAQWSSSHSSPLMGASTTPEYIPVLSRPQVLQNAKHFVWGSIYYDHLGLGMMTTVTLPVYNRTAGSSNQTILGVMGIDVTTADMMKKSPARKLGPNGYSFAVNPNGYIIFHPNLKATDYMRDPPNVDFLEIEVENEKKRELRTALVKQMEGTVVIDTSVLTPDMSSVSRDNVTYSYEKIVNTSFSLGVSVPSYQKFYPDFNGAMDKFNHKFLKSSLCTLLIPPWNFYENMHKAENLTGTMHDIVSALSDPSKADKWDKDLLLHLYWDAKVLDTLGKFIPVVNDKLIVTDGLECIFATTNGGITQIYPKDKSAAFKDQRDPLTADYYKKIMSSEQMVFFVDPNAKTVVDGNDTIAPDITVGKAVTIKNGEAKTVYKPAAIGIKLKNRKFVELLMKETTSSADNTLDDFFDCSNSDNINCYLVNDGGFLIASNQEEHTNGSIGKFLGRVDPPVMASLLNRSVYERIKHYDYQVTHDCVDTEKEVSAGFSSFRVPSINLLYDALTLNWWTTKFAWAYMNFNFWNSWFSSSEVYGEEESSSGVVESCVEVMYIYYFGPQRRVSDSVECDNCTRRIIASRMPKHSDLLLVVTDSVCHDCETMYEPIPQEPVKVSEEEEEEVICDMARYPRYRKPVEECYSKDPGEDASKCGGKSNHSPSILHVLLSLAVISVGVHSLTSPSS